MRYVFPLLLILATIVPAAQKKRNQPKPPDVAVIELKAARSEGRVAVDGRVKNNSAKPIEGLLLLLDFMAPGRQVITTKRGAVEREVIEPGDESEFHLHMIDPVRAVEVRVGAEDGSGRDLRVANSGPFVIE